MPNKSVVDKLLKMRRNNTLKMSGRRGQAIQSRRSGVLYDAIKRSKYLEQKQKDSAIPFVRGSGSTSNPKSLCDISITDTIKRATQEYWETSTEKRHEFLFKTNFEGIDDVDIKTILFYHKYKKTPKPLQGNKYSELEKSVLFNKNSNTGGLPTKTLIYIANKFGEASFKENTSKKRVVLYLTYMLYLRGGKSKFEKYLSPKTTRPKPKKPKAKPSKPDECSYLRDMKLEKGKNCEPPINYKKTLLKIHPDKAKPECKDVATEKTQELNNLCGRDGSK